LVSTRLSAEGLSCGVGRSNRETDNGVVAMSVPIAVDAR
jgi:hypothetical protein